MSRLIHDLCDWMRIPHAEPRSKRNPQKGPSTAPVEPGKRNTDAETRSEEGPAEDSEKRAGRP